MSPRMSHSFHALPHPSQWEFIDKVVKPMLALEGDRLPVSVLEPEGFMPPGTTQVRLCGSAGAGPQV